MITDEQLKALEEANESRSQGEWEYFEGEKETWPVAMLGDGYAPCGVYSSAINKEKFGHLNEIPRDGAFIALAANSMSSLLSEVRRLREENALTEVLHVEHEKAIIENARLTADYWRMRQCLEKITELSLNDNLQVGEEPYEDFDIAWRVNSHQKSQMARDCLARLKEEKK